MSTAPTTGGQRVIYVPLEHEPEVTQEVLFRSVYRRVFVLIPHFLGLRHRYLSF